MKRTHIIQVMAVAVVLLAVGGLYLARTGGKGAGRKTVEDRVRQYGEVARDRLKPHFDQAGVNYPPQHLTFVGLKDERTLQVYATDAGGKWRFIYAYPILGASGTAGPKLHEGDYQVPEGIYAIESLNPNSSYHLSLRVNYPNFFDRQQADREGRTDLGGDIMIHGDVGSVGCLAMGDEASEDLFVLAADTGLRNLAVILSPVDFRTGKTVTITNRMPAWTGTLYAEIKGRLAELPPELEPK